jgi:peptidoglycan hydrolase-like protein with peptidoglycan-binding domain
MARGFLLVSILLAITIGCASGDEQTRRVQEELRKRNLYFGDIDGRVTPELAGALRHYQERKGFEVTGSIDRETASSLNVPATGLSVEPKQTWPDVPVLKSDAARNVTDIERTALERAADEAGVPSPSAAPPPAEPPSAAQDLTPDRVQRMVDNYLRDAETQNIPAQTQYYSYPIDYFDHGLVDRTFVENDTRNYVNRWPQRRYLLLGSPSFAAAAKENETVVEFDIAFTVAGKNHSGVKGKTRNYWTIRPEGEELKIVAIREERLRDDGHAGK